MKFNNLLFFAIASVIPIIGFSQNSNKNEILVFFSDGIAHKTQNFNDRKTEMIQFTKEELKKSIYKMGIADSLFSVAMPGFSKADTLMMLKNGEKIKMPDYSKLYKIRTSDKQNMKELLTKLNALPDVLYAEPNAIDTLYSFVAPNDPTYKYQWGLNNFNRYADIDAEKAWEIFKGNPNSIIAIIDQRGVDKNHYDLKNKITGGDNSFNTTETHGTEMAGVAAAETNNGRGMAGVDWYAKIHPQKITTEYSVIASAITDAVNYDKNVHVLNCSWGIKGNSITVRNAFAYAYKANRTCVAAIGNNQDTDPNVVYYPAGYSNSIAVGATDNIDEKWDESVPGNHIDVCAPGVGIKVFGDSESHNGTSYSAAFVSGLASLLKGYNNDLANDDIDNIIKLGADDQEDPGFDLNTGYGRINAKNSLDFLRPPYTLYQWSTIGGTVYQTSGLAYGTFMGVEGLRDGKYWARRHEVRKAVSFSERFTEITGAWGRGTFTKGFNNENPNLGVGYCAIVPGTLNESGCTLTTYVYEVITSTGVKYFPRAPSNVTYAYSVLGISQKISGPGIICSSGATYTVENVPAGQTVIWNYSSNLRQSSIGTNTITLIPISNGSGWISATIGNITTSQKPLNVGIPSTPTSITNFCCNGMGFKTETAYVFSTSMPGATQYDWIVSGGVILYGQGTNSITVLTSQAPGSGISFGVSVRAVNNCGWSSYLQRGGFVAPNWGTALFSVYPNPTSSEVTISVLDINSLSNTDSNNEKISISNIEIIDHFGNIRKKVKKGTKQEAVTINISDLSKGIYLIKIGYGLKEESHKLLIE